VIKFVPRQGFGKGNMGPGGIKAFLGSHRCNAICAALRLPQVGSFKPLAEGNSSLINLQSTHSALNKTMMLYLLLTGGTVFSAPVEVHSVDEEVRQSTYRTHTKIIKHSHSHTCTQKMYGYLYMHVECAPQIEIGND
jgi:hypothetical protein